MELTDIPLQFTTTLPLETLAWLAGGAAALVTLMYLLKLRKRRVEVPFSPLWGRVLTEYKQQTDLWRRLKRLLSWLLQLLLIAALLFALADPHTRNEVVEGRNIVVMVDTSASMASTDVSGGVDRLDIARQKARKIFETVGPEDRIMLVDFNDQLQPLSPFVADVSILEQPLKGLEVSATGTSFEEALSFAADSLRDKERGELIILSDGAGLEVEKFEKLDFGDSTNVRHIEIGEASENLAVTAFNVRRYMANKLDYELFVRVQSYFPRPVEAELQIIADGELVDVKKIQLGPEGILQEFFPAQAVAGERLEARVKLLSTDARDVFPLDDRAYALLPAVERQRIRIVTRGNLYLEGPLLLNPNIDVTRVTPDEYDVDADFDITIFDRLSMPLPPEGNFVYIDPQGEHAPWESASGAIDDPIITSYRRSHPLMRWLTMRDVNIGQASRLRLKSGDEVVASAFGKPMIVARKQDRRNFVAIAFDIRNSDLPLRVAYPVLWLNIIDYFTLDDDSYIQNYRSGTTWSVRVPEEAKEATVTMPDDSELEVPVYDGRAIVYGEQTGFYVIEAAEQSQTIAANLADLKESRIGPRTIELPETKLTTDATSLFFDRHQLWIWAVLAVFALLLVEWWTYNRRITV